MRIILALLATVLLSTPTLALAWEAGVEGRICTLDYSDDSTEVRLTYDPAGPEYTISITRAEAWPLAPLFSLEFTGGAANTISTTRHVLSEDRRTLTVADRGFGNVLSGMAFNRRALALTGDARVEIDLDGAAPEVAAFAACEATPAV